MDMTHLQSVLKQYVPMRERTIPAWDNVLSKMVRLQSHEELTDKPGRMLLDKSVLARLPNSPRRCIKGIRDFMLKWLGDEHMRTELKTRMLQYSPYMTGVMLSVGQRSKDGSLIVSLSTVKGFIAVRLENN